MPIPNQPIPVMSLRRRGFIVKLSLLWVDEVESGSLRDLLSYRYHSGYRQSLPAQPSSEKRSYCTGMLGYTRFGRELRPYSEQYGILAFTNRSDEFRSQPRNRAYCSPLSTKLAFINIFINKVSQLDVAAAAKFWLSAFKNFVRSKWYRQSTLRVQEVQQTRSLARLFSFQSRGANTPSSTGFLRQRPQSFGFLRSMPILYTKICTAELQLEVAGMCRQR